MIDFHAHTSDKEMWRLHTHSATLDDLERYADKYGIEKIVLMATYFPFKKGGLPNRELLRRIKGRERFLAFGSLDAMNNLYNGIQELRELASSGEIHGIKLYPGYQDFSLSNGSIFPVYEIAAEYGLPVAIHSGELHHCCPKDIATNMRVKCGGRCYIDELGNLARPREVIGAALEFPNVKFVMCHLGNPFFSELRDVMRQCPNVYTDISGQFTSGTTEDYPGYREVLADEMWEFLQLPCGSGRMIFGSDFPIQSYMDSIELVLELGLAKEVEDKIFHNNAAKILNLKEG